MKESHVNKRVSRCYGTRPTVHQSPEVRPRATVRGPARSIQPGHIEFGTGNWVLLVCFDGNRNWRLLKIPSRHTNSLEELADLKLYLSRS
eukprot:COSAG02_NODE_4762_length_5013_cov_5.204314_9_plen_89_part_01